MFFRDVRSALYFGCGLWDCLLFVDFGVGLWDGLCITLSSYDVLVFFALKFFHFLGLESL